MASVRTLKKDINFLTSELVTQAYLNQLIFDKISDDALVDHITKAVDFRNNFVERANHPDGKDNAKLVKAYYRTLRKEMVEEFGVLYEALAQQLKESAQ